MRIRIRIRNTDHKAVYFGPYSLFINEIEKVDIIKNLQLTKISAKKLNRQHWTICSSGQKMGDGI
jgi:hypothetical protein